MMVVVVFVGPVLKLRWCVVLLTVVSFSFSLFSFSLFSFSLFSFSFFSFSLFSSLFSLFSVVVGQSTKRGVQCLNHGGVGCVFFYKFLESSDDGSMHGRTNKNRLRRVVGKQISFQRIQEREIWYNWKPSQ